MTLDDLLNLEELIQEVYDVEKNDMISKVKYVTTGVVLVNASDLTSEEVEQFLIEGLSNATGANIEDILFSFDKETGEVHYTVESSSYEQLSEIASILEESSFLELLNQNLDSDIIKVAEFNADDSIVGEVTMVINGDATSVSTTGAQNTLAVLLGSTFSIETQGNNY